ncbi:hypothetical protein EYS00_06835 [Alteromonas sp. KUL49]|nr:hypothetical protein EYS00_06835 [Alteromonas sp. KUL49]
MLKNCNMNSTNRLRSYLGPLTIFFVAVAIFTVHRYQQALQNNAIPYVEIGNTCNFVNNRCELLIEGQKITASFSQHPEVEESVTLVFNGLNGMAPESAWIEGVNMYMGKIPVLLTESGNDQWSGWFMLGSCSEPQMQWRIQLNITGKESVYFLHFSTVQ